MDLCKEEMLFPEASDTCLSDSSVWEPSLRVPLTQPLQERDAQIPESALTCLSEPPAKKTPTGSPYGAPTWRNTFHFQSPLLRFFQCPKQTSSPLQVPPSEPHRKGRSVSRVFFHTSLEVPAETVPSPSPPTRPPCIEMPVTKDFFVRPEVHRLIVHCQRKIKGSGHTVKAYTGSRSTAPLI
jgi:hypothetical protein